METWSKRQLQQTDWPLLRLHYPCCLPRTWLHRCLLIQCAAVKPAVRGGLFRMTFIHSHSIHFNIGLCLRNIFPILCPNLQGNLRWVREGITAASEPLVRGSVLGSLHLSPDGNTTSRRPRPTSGKRQGGHEGTGGQVQQQLLCFLFFTAAFFFIAFLSTRCHC